MSSDICFSYTCYTIIDVSLSESQLEESTMYNKIFGHVFSALGLWVLNYRLFLLIPLTKFYTTDLYSSQ